MRRLIKVSNGVYGGRSIEDMELDKYTLLILGAGGHGKVAADAALKTEKYRRVCFLDDADIKQCMNFPVIGRCDQVFDKVRTCEIFVAIGNANVRKRFIEKLEAQGAEIATLIHPDAVVGRSVQIGIGSIVMAGAVLNSECKLGKGCIVNTCSSVDHECCIGDYVHISVGAHVAGAVDIGSGTWIGAGAVVNNNLHITDSCMIGSGAVVIKNIEEKGTYVGVPARRIKMNRTMEVSVKEGCEAGGIWGGVILRIKVASLLLLLARVQAWCGR